MNVPPLLFLFFQFEDSTLSIYGTIDEPWFSAKNLARILDIQNHKNFVRSLGEEQKRRETIQTEGGPQEITLIEEAAAYEMIFQSRKANAVRFKKWVFKTVLPELRRKGRYELETQNMQSQARLEELQEVVKQQERELSKSRLFVEKRFMYHMTIKEACENHPNPVFPPYFFEKVFSQAPCLWGENIINSQQHPDRAIVTSKLQAISLRMVKPYKQYHNVLQVPKLKGKNINAYTVEDFDNFGYAVIEEFVEQYPLDTWGLQDSSLLW